MKKMEEEESEMEGLSGEESEVEGVVVMWVVVWRWEVERGRFEEESLWRVVARPVRSVMGYKVLHSVDGTFAAE
jgi:hypothetical protein